MAVISELIRTEENGKLSFGDYTRNGLFVYESVPGTAVMDFEETADTVTFTVEGPEDAQITLGLEEETEYEIDIAGAVAGTMKTNLGGKLSLSVELEGVDSVDIKVSRK